MNTISVKKPEINLQIRSLLKATESLSKSDLELFILYVLQKLDDESITDLTSKVWIEEVRDVFLLEDEFFVKIKILGKTSDFCTGSRHIEYCEVEKTSDTIDCQEVLYMGDISLIHLPNKKFELSDDRPKSINATIGSSFVLKLLDLLYKKVDNIQSDFRIRALLAIDTFRKCVV